MTCNHTNPAGHVFCGTCGELLPHLLCRCGFVGGVNETYCGRCGASLTEGGRQTGEGARVAIDADHRFDLEKMAEMADQEQQYMETTHKARVTQDDIRKLLAKRGKKF